MYGMVNQAIEDLITKSAGKETWDRIKAAAGVDVDVFISNEPYDDAITYKLVSVAGDVLNVSADALLERFGEHWVEAAREGYGALLDAGGRTLPEFLANLPNFHARVVLMFPRLEPPRFRCTDVNADSLRLHYYSHRPGFAPFVVGLLRGLGKKFGTEVAITHACDRRAGADHDEFVVHWHEPMPR